MTVRIIPSEDSTKTESKNYDVSRLSRYFTPYTTDFCTVASASSYNRANK